MTLSLDAGGWPKNIVLTLVERGGSARSLHVDGYAARDLMPAVRANIAKETVVNTDEAKAFYDVSKEFAGRDAVNHAQEENARREGERLVTTNTVEGYFSIFKGGMKGTDQHCREKHLHRYLSEFDFRYSNRVALGVDDIERTARAVKGIVGKRLTYATPRN
jgi:hypothetical protein